jgi:hypothetical protein
MGTQNDQPTRIGEDAFAKWCLPHHDKLFAFIRRCIPDHHAAEDVLQETYGVATNSQDFTNLARVSDTEGIAKLLWTVVKCQVATCQRYLSSVN